MSLRDRPRGWEGPGVITWGRIFAPLEGRSDGRRQPIVLIREVRRVGQPFGWRVLGLTRTSHYKTTMEPRPALAGWAEAGLDAPGYVFSNRPVTMGFCDIDSKPVGRVTDADAEMLGRLMGDDTFARSVAADRERSAA